MPPIVVSEFKVAFESESRLEVVNGGAGKDDGSGSGFGRRRGGGLGLWGTFMAEGVGVADCRGGYVTTGVGADGESSLLRVG